MRKRILVALLGIGLGAIVLVALLARSAVSAQPVSAPGARERFAQALAGIGAIVEADIVNARYTYDDQVGPRTAFDLTNIVVHAGSANVPTTLSQFGGPLPDGSIAGASELPVLTPGSRYILFLTSRSWFWTPVSTVLHFRIEDVGGKSILLGPTGYPVRTLDVNGVSYGGNRVVDTDGAIDPLAPLFRRPEVDSTADTAISLDHDSFVSAAVEAVKAAGGPLGATLSPAPTPLGPDWRMIKGTAQ